jgi:Domain of unknown function (DU1801)
MLNTEVSSFLDEANHPLRAEIEVLRECILSACDGLSEIVKWNGPNYVFDHEDRITMRIFPPKQLQLVFHCGAKVKEQPKDKLIKDDSGILVWKSNDRAVASFKNMQEIQSQLPNIAAVVAAWVSVKC